MTPEKKPDPPARPSGHGVLPVNPLTLRPARRAATPAEPGRIERRPVADSAAKSGDDVLTREQQRLAAEVERLRGQLGAERQALAAQQQLMEERLADQAAIEQARSEQAEAVRRLEIERSELEDLRRQIEGLREGLAVERNTLEVERSGLAGQRSAIEAATAKLGQDRSRIARLTEDLAIEREELLGSQAAMAERQKDLEASQQTLAAELKGLSAAGDQLSAERQSIQAEKSRLSESNEQLAAQRQAIEAEQSRLSASNEQFAAQRQTIQDQREELERQQEELRRRTSELDRERREAEEHTRRLAEVERSLAQRSEQLSETEAQVRERTARLAAEEQEHRERQAQFEQTAASARAADDMARRTQQDIERQVSRQREAAAPAGPETVAGAPHLLPLPKSQAAPKLPVSSAFEAQARAESSADRADAEPAETGASEMPGRRLAGDPRYETASAADDDVQALLTDLHSPEEEDAYGAARDELRGAAEELEAEEMAVEGGPRVGGESAWGRRRLPVGLVLMVAAAGVVALLAFSIGPWLRDRSGADGDSPPEGTLMADSRSAESSESAAAAKVEKAPGTETEPGQPVEHPAETLPPDQPPSDVPPPVKPETMTQVGTQPPAPPVETPATTPGQTTAETTTTPTEMQPTETPGTTLLGTTPTTETTAVKTAAPEKAEAPGGVWAYKAPEKLTPGPAEEDLKPTLDWVKRVLAEQIVSVRRAYGMPETAGPRQAIAIRLTEDLAQSLRAYVPPPYWLEKVAGTDGVLRDEQVSTLVFLEFTYADKPCLFVAKRRLPGGQLVAGRQGSFVLVPGTIQEHTVVLDPTRKAVREPAAP